MYTLFGNVIDYDYFKNVIDCNLLLLLITINRGRYLNPIVSSVVNSTK